MPSIYIHSFNQFTYSGPASELTATQGAGLVGETLTYNGGTGTALDINDDDGFFQDGYVETGGSQTLNSSVTIDGVTYPAGSTVEVEYAVLDATGTAYYIVRIGSTNVGVVYPSGQDPDPGDVISITDHRDGAAGDSGDGVSSTVPYDQLVVCFASGTHILTPEGERPVETLCVRDMACTLDHGPQPIRWIGRIDIESPAEEDKPIEFKAGSLGQGRPLRPLAVSPQHRMLVRLPTGEECLAPAKAFLDQPGVRRKSGTRRVTYYHLFLERHAVLIAEGAMAESFFPGSYVLSKCEADMHRELSRAFPDLEDYHPARRLLGVTPAQEALRHKMRCLQTA